MSGDPLLAERPASMGKQDEPVLAERDACLQVLGALRDRFAALDTLSDDDGDEAATIDLEAFRVELRRADEAVESMRQGLHRVGEG